MNVSNEVLEWIRLADMDLSTSRHMFNTFWPIPLEIVCFHSQQASEKMLKCFLVANEIEPPKTHDMQVLVELCIELNSRFNDIYHESVTLTNYAVRFRYPAELGLVKYDANKAIKDAEKIMGFVKEVLTNKSITATIRLAKPADVPVMADIHTSSWSAAYRDIIPAEFIKEKNASRMEQWKKIVTDENTTHHIMEVNGAAVGMMTLAPPKDDDVDDSFYEIHGIYLRPEFYRKGIGTQAVSFAIDEARKLGKRFMVLWVLEENENSVNFYKKCGFEPDGKTNIRDFGKSMKIIRMCRAIG